jgi:hypothetical protein
MISDARDAIAAANRSSSTLTTWSQRKCPRPSSKIAIAPARVAA